MPSFWRWVIVCLQSGLELNKGHLELSHCCTRASAFDEEHGTGLNPNQSVSGERTPGTSDRPPSSSRGSGPGRQRTALSFPEQAPPLAPLTGCLRSLPCPLCSRKAGCTVWKAVSFCWWKQGGKYVFMQEGKGWWGWRYPSLWIDGPSFLRRPV